MHLITILNTDGSQKPRGQIASVPVARAGNQDFVIRYPIKPGDLGWLKACDRDISLFLQGYKKAKPNTFRTFNFSDGVFTPDSMKPIIVTAEDEAGMTIQSIDGTVCISLIGGTIRLRAPGGVTIENDLIVEGSIVAEGGITTSGGGDNSMIINGNVQTVGNITATGDITAHVPPPEEL